MVDVLVDAAADVAADVDRTRKALRGFIEQIDVLVHLNATLSQKAPQRISTDRISQVKRTAP
jgi:hypothetical protein